MATNGTTNKPTEWSRYVMCGRCGFQSLITKPDLYYIDDEERNAKRLRVGCRNCGVDLRLGTVCPSMDFLSDVPEKPATEAAIRILRASRLRNALWDYFAEAAKFHAERYQPVELSPVKPESHTAWKGDVEVSLYNTSHRLDVLTGRLDAMEAQLAGKPEPVAQDPKSLDQLRADMLNAINAFYVASEKQREGSAPPFCACMNTDGETTIRWGVRPKVEPLTDEHTTVIREAQAWKAGWIREGFGRPVRCSGLWDALGAIDAKQA